MFAPELAALLDQRAERVPLQHLTGRAPFRHLELAVGPGVFVPRPETETLVDEALRRGAVRARQGRRPLVVLDLCTGSGAIAAAVAVGLTGVLAATGGRVAFLGREIGGLLGNQVGGGSGKQIATAVGAGAGAAAGTQLPSCR